MCGIVGVFGQSTDPLLNLFSLMLQVDVIRGSDSTGVAAVLPNYKVQTIKSLGVPQSILWSDKYRNKIHRQNPICLIGHNRAATVGAVEQRNAHPFTFGHITLVHNGTLSYYDELAAGNEHIQTDSEAIAWSIYKNGIDWTWKRIYGAAALVWWDAKERSLNIVSNGKRPITFAYSSDKRKVVFASESWMIRELVGKVFVHLGGANVLAPNPHWMFSYTINDKGLITEQSRKLEAPTIITHYQNEPWWAHGVKQAGRALGYVMPKDKEGADQVVPFDNFSTKKGISKEEFHNTYHICKFCDESLLHEYDKAVIIDEINAACASCASIAINEHMSLWAS